MGTLRLAIVAMGILGVALALAGCSKGGDMRASSTDTTHATTKTDNAAPPDDEGGIVIATLGDSITAGTPLWDPDEEVRARIDQPDQTNQWQYWAKRKHPGLSFRNCGVNRQTTAEIRARLADCADGAAVLVVQGGINDLAQGRSPDVAADNLREMVRDGKRMGLQVVLVNVLPWNAGYPQFVAGIKDLNGRIATIAADEKIPLLPFYEALEDPEQPGRMRDTYTIDGSHPSPAGHRVLGEQAFTAPSAVAVP